MKVRRCMLRLMTYAATIIAALVMAAPPATLAAAPTTVVDDGPTADNCGKYDGKSAETDVVTTIAAAPTGSTIIICPGTYPLNGVITIPSRKLTIKRAVTGPGSHPILIAPNSNVAVNIIDSTVTMDGVIVDGRGNTVVGYRGINLLRSSATIKNTMLIGPQGGDGIVADATGQSKAMKLSISASSILGYNYGVSVDGPIKLSVTGSTFDGTDGGRITSVPSLQTAIYFSPSTAPGLTPSGTVSKSQFANSQTGVSINGANKVSITSNAFFNSQQSVSVTVDGAGANNADNIKIAGNIIMGVPAGGIGIVIQNTMVPVFTIRNATISKNVIAAARYGGSRAILVSASMATTTALTVTVTDNMLLGFLAGSRIINVGGRAKVTEKNTNATP